MRALRPSQANKKPSEPSPEGLPELMFRARAPDSPATANVKRLDFYF
jgi:hypothetical protein